MKFINLTQFKKLFIEYLKDVVIYDKTDKQYELSQEILDMSAILVARRLDVDGDIERLLIRELKGNLDKYLERLPVRKVSKCDYIRKDVLLDSINKLFETRITKI